MKDDQGGKGRFDRKRHKAGEVMALSRRSDLVLDVEELESRLEMQNVPVGALGQGCPIQAENCYSDGCEGQYCEQCMENNCPGHCFCFGGWCEQDCNPECLAFCMQCISDIVCVGADAW